MDTSITNQTKLGTNRCLISKSKEVKGCEKINKFKPRQMNEQIEKQTTWELNQGVVVQVGSGTITYHATQIG